ncbi:MAG TPA: hypothetical protein PKY87_01525 [Terricaulis sp.]|nr:hypothetical protein [Terricaulis sp.]
MMRAILALFALTLAACAAPAEDAAPVQNTAEAQCAAQGGQLERVGRAQTLQCVITYADAGAACSDGSACQAGRCIAEPQEDAQAPVKGQCQATNQQFGCYSTIVNGSVTTTICVD